MAPAHEHVEDGGNPRDGGDDGRLLHGTPTAGARRTGKDRSRDHGQDDFRNEEGDVPLDRETSCPHQPREPAPLAIDHRPARDQREQERQLDDVRVPWIDEAIAGRGEEEQQCPAGDHCGSALPRQPTNTTANRHQAHEAHDRRADQQADRGRAEHAVRHGQQVEEPRPEVVETEPGIAAHEGRVRRADCVGPHQHQGVVA